MPTAACCNTTGSTVRIMSATFRLSSILESICSTSLHSMRRSRPHAHTKPQGEYGPGITRHGLNNFTAATLDSRNAVVIVIDEVVFVISRVNIVCCFTQVMDASLGPLPTRLVECFVPTSDKTCRVSHAPIREHRIEPEES